jgi:hypothetical protein
MGPLFNGKIEGMHIQQKQAFVNNKKHQVISETLSQVFALVNNKIVKFFIALALGRVDC